MKRHHIVKRVKSEVRKNLACAEYLLLEMGIHTEARRPESLTTVTRWSSTVAVHKSNQPQLRGA